MVRYYNSWRSIVIDAIHEYEDEKKLFDSRQSGILKELAEFYKEHSEISWPHKIQLLHFKSKIEQSNNEIEREHHYNNWILYTRNILTEQIRELRVEMSKLVVEKETGSGTGEETETENVVQIEVNVENSIEF
uniref:Uncharacterized protein n=1 Tax=Caenorhabditis tropicalis TaxID=1561998 RepID=A0A1I7SYA2_9PELO